MLNTTKEQLKEYYNNNVEEREKSKKPSWKFNIRKKFLDIMKDSLSHSLLEIGAGTGRDSLYFKKNGLNVTAIDLSEQHILKCKEKGIDAYIMDFADMSFENNKFDCVYAMNCLLHIPNDEINQVINEVKRVVNSDGLLFFCQYGTCTANYDEEIKDNGAKGCRFFSFRSYTYFKEILESASLYVIESGNIDVGEIGYNAQYFILRNDKSS